MKKTFCIDTNVFLYDPKAIFAFEDNDVVIPLVVLEEIDRQKKRPDDAGRNARAVNRMLDELRHQGDLMKGIVLPGGGTLRILRSDYDASMPVELDPKLADNLIISTAITLAASSGVQQPVMLITKDISMRIKCDVLGMPCDDYLKHRVAGSSELIHGGVRVVDVGRDVIDDFHRSRSVDALRLGLEHDLVPNEFVVLRNPASPSGSGLGRSIGGNVRHIVGYDDIWGLRPRNKEQRFALDMLMDQDIQLATLIGPAGTGKTLLALAAGLKQVLEEKKYQKLVVSRPIQPLGRDIGYLPGTKEEKMEPWIQPIVDNLEFLFGKSKGTMGMYFDDGTIEVEAITYIRGRSIPNAYIIIDESQNLVPHELKTIITRAGDGTKVVLTGDIEQVDNTQVDAVSNGLTYAVEKFKSHDLAAHITLRKGERSPLATLAAQIL